MPSRHSLLTNSLCLHNLAAAILRNQPNPCGNLTYRNTMIQFLPTHCSAEDRRCQEKSFKNKCRKRTLKALNKVNVAVMRKKRSCMQYKLEKNKEHSAEIGEKIADADEKLSIILLVRTSVLDNKGKKTLTGKI